MITKGLKNEIERLLGESCLKPVQVFSSASVGGGCINETLRINTTAGFFFMKKNDANKFPGMFEAEAKGLLILKNAGAIEVPAVIAAGKCMHEEFILMEWIESGKRKNKFFEDFGSKLACLHRCTNESFGLNHDNYIGSLIQSNKPAADGLEFFIRQRLQPQWLLALKNNLISDRVAKDFEKLASRLPSLLPAEIPALIHGDLWSGNFMTGKFGYPCIFDPAVSYGLREGEIAMTMLFGGFAPEFYHAYNEEYPMQAGWRNRMEIYNLYPLLVHVNLFGGSYARQVEQILEKYV